MVMMRPLRRSTSSRSDLEETCCEQREGEAFADHRWDVLDREIQHYNVDEEVDDVGRPGADPPSNGTLWATRFSGGYWPIPLSHGTILVHIMLGPPVAPIATSDSRQFR